MKEILAERLQPLFKNTSLRGECTYRGGLYEVWEVSDEDFKIMCDMSEEDFRKVCPDGMWRSSDGSNLGVPDIDYVINNNKIVAWDGTGRRDYFKDFCKDCSDREDGMCCATERDINECHGERRYGSLLEYLCEEVGASQPRNVCACVVDLAKENGIKVSELFNKLL